MLKLFSSTSTVRIPQGDPPLRARPGHLFALFTTQREIQVSCDHKWKKHVKDNSTCWDHQDRQWGRRTREPLKNLQYRTWCFPFALWKIYLRMNAIINLGETARSLIESLIEIHYSQYIFVGSRRMWYLDFDEGAWEPSKGPPSRWQIVFASSLDPRKRFVLRYSICLVSRDEKPKWTSKGGSLVNEKCVFVNIYGCNSKLIGQKLICQFGKNLNNCIKCVSFKLRVHQKLSIYFKSTVAFLLLYFYIILSVISFLFFISENNDFC